MPWAEAILECELCGDLSYDVKSGLACFSDDGRFERMDRCTDHQLCRNRLEESGEEWPLLDVTDRWVTVR